MDISGAAGSAVSQVQGGNTRIDIAVEKKALEMQKQVASQLIEAVPDPDSSLGQNVDVSV